MGSEMTDLPIRRKTGFVLHKKGWIISHFLIIQVDLTKLFI